MKKYLLDDLNKCYFIGDSWVDVEAGKRLGVKTVLIDRKQTGNQIKADYNIQDLREILHTLNIK